jgi:glyoxylase-like metal-dependent hydrolase (beta-lactamase superfamily II)
MRRTSAFLIGAGTAYLFDPQEGRGRRHALRDRSLRALRRLGRAGIGKVKLVGGHGRGLAAVARRAITRPDVAVDDATVTQRIRSDAFREAGVSTKNVEVEVEEGLARLHGTVENAELADRLVARVRKVPGVNEVSTELHVVQR